MKWIQIIRYVYTHTHTHTHTWNIIQPYKGHLAMCGNMEGPYQHRAKGNKSEKDKYHMISLLHGV